MPCGISLFHVYWTVCYEENGGIMKKWKSITAVLLCVLCLLPGTAAAAEETGDTGQEFLFEDGDVVGFIGDSITHVEYTGISYQEFIYNYYITRYPGWSLEFRNLGTSSYTAADAVALYREKKGIRDAELDGITKAVVMFGMNEALHMTSPEAYIKNIQELVKLLEERGLKPEDIILVAPTPYDQTRSSNYAEDGKLHETTDDLLGQYAPRLKSLASELGTHYVDLHTPMLWVTGIVQNKISDDTLTITDNVHPNAMGNVMAGFFFLKQQGADSQVASVRITAEGKAETREAVVKGLRRKGDRYIRYKYQADSLPMAVSYEFHEATQYMDVIDELSQELLQVDGLKAAVSYSVYINHFMIGEYTGEELGKGINLTDCDLNPRQAAAKEIEVLNQEWQRVSADYRAQVRKAAKGEITQEELDVSYESWRGGTEAIRDEMYEIARENAEKTYKVEIVSKDYHVWMGQEVWHWAAAAAAFLLAVAACVVLIYKRKKH